MAIEVICGIYKIESPTGRVYIGQSKNIYSRWKSHKKECGTVLSSSMMKHGWDNHLFSIIEEMSVNSSISEKTKREVYHYERYEELGCVMLNMQKPNERGCFGHSEETKKQIRKSLEGRKQTEQEKLNHSIAAKKFTNTPKFKAALSKARKGVPISKEHVEKSRASQKKIWTTEKRAEKSKITKAYYLKKKQNGN